MTPIEKPALPEPFGYFCEWKAAVGFPPSQAMYYGGPGNGIDDDWNLHPEVYKNLVVFTADQLEAYAAPLLARIEELSRVAELVVQAKKSLDDKDWSLLRADLSEAAELAALSATKEPS